MTRQLRTARKAAGLCYRCGNPAITGRTQCEGCAGTTIVGMRDRRRRLAAAGLCVYCGASPSAPDRVGCRPCMDRKAAVAARQPKAHRRSVWRKAALRKYGLTEAAFLEMSAAQLGLCAVCDGPPSDARGLVVDHDHATGKVRGILCGKCNSAAGLLNDSPDRAQALAYYLRPYDDGEGAEVHPGRSAEAQA